MDDESAAPAGPGEWKDPVHCHGCGGDAVRLVEMRYEMALYECERCGTRFEEEA